MNGTTSDRASRSREALRSILAVLVFGTAFGFIEAAVVIDLRAVYEPIHRVRHPSAAPGELFPMLTIADLDQGPPGARRLLEIEVAREAATIALLAGFGLAIGGRPLRMFAGFVAAFGVWDLVFYGALWALIGWPSSLGTWDVLFLIPRPWTGPVLAPMLVAATMVACGFHTILRDRSGSPLAPGWRGWLGVFLGSLVLLAAFLWNAEDAMAGRSPTTFPWPLFAVGLVVAQAAYIATAAAGSALSEPGPER